MTESMPPPTISVSANVEREIEPDTYTVTARVTGEGKDAKSATADLVRHYRELESSAKSFPSTVEVRHGAIASWPGWGRRPRASAHRTMTVTSSDATTVGDVADALAAVEGAAIEGPYWRLDRDNPAYAQLQTDVVGEVRGRAERYATALGGALGRLVELRDPESSGGHNYHGAVLAARAAGGPEVSSLDLSPQPITIRAAVDATWYVELPD
jgi:uncharacterized protein YggE